MNGQKLYFGGLPTEPQVRKLDEAFQNIAQVRGTTIPHEQIEEIIKEKRGSFRYKTITNRWRKRIEARTGIVISGRGEAVRVGFRVLLDGEQLDFGISERKGAGRKIRRWHSTISSIDSKKLTAAQQTIQEHEMLSAARLHLVMVEIRKKQITTSSLPETAQRPAG